MNDMSLKARIRNIAKDRNISAQAVLQNYMLGRFLCRLSHSEYADKFVVKGGMLIASIIGIDHRSTMDIDVTLRNLPLSAESVETAVKNICAVPSDDNFEFVFNSIAPIRDDDEYGGYRVGLSAVFGKINSALTIDVSTGDIITPGAEKHTFTDILNNDDTFELWSYTTETVLAEKTETIISRGTGNTRPRDYYDVYMLSSLKYDPKIFREALLSTSKHRGSKQSIDNSDEIIEIIAGSPELKQRWDNYKRQMPYAAEIEYADTIVALKALLKTSS